MQTKHLQGKRILVTGGTGTFGNAMIALLSSIKGIEKIIVLSRDEYKQSQMHAKFKDPRIQYFLGDIRDKSRLQRAFNQVDIVIHAAALKQVPALEYNPSEAVETNVQGTRNVIDAALDQNVPHVMVISSDKAVQPINLYGATKLCAERLAIASNAYRGAHGKTRVSVMRYGNVLGSRGSIIELIEQRRATGEIPLTDERMTRFWIPIEKVVAAVLESLAIMEGGEIFIPKMKSTKVKDLMRVVAPECKLKVVGMRPGEKLHETLITEYEANRTKVTERLFVIEPEFAPWGRNDPLKKYPSFKKDVAYASDSTDALLPAKRAGEVLKA